MRATAQCIEDAIEQSHKIKFKNNLLNGQQNMFSALHKKNIYKKRFNHSFCVFKKMEKLLSFFFLFKWSIRFNWKCCDILCLPLSLEKSQDKHIFSTKLLLDEHSNCHKIARTRTWDFRNFIMPNAQSGSRSSAYQAIQFCMVLSMQQHAPN